MTRVYMAAAIGLVLACTVPGGVNVFFMVVGIGCILTGHKKKDAWSWFFCATIFILLGLFY